jgi:hypothetical protein
MAAARLAAVPVGTDEVKIRPAGKTARTDEIKAGKILKLDGKKHCHNRNYEVHYMVDKSSTKTRAWSSASDFECVEMRF